MPGSDFLSERAPIDRRAHSSLAVVTRYKGVIRVVTAVGIGSGNFAAVIDIRNKAAARARRVDNGKGACVIDEAVRNIRRIVIKSDHLATIVDAVRDGGG